MQESPNLLAEIKGGMNGIHTTAQNTRIDFNNGSKIFAVVYGEGSLGVRANILIVDEFVRTEKEVISRVFVPFLTDVRKPRYIDLTNEERAKIPDEPNKQLYLSSIRGADEWSYKYYQEYLDYMAHDDMRYTTVVLPYQFGLKNGFINRDIVEQQFKEGKENIDMLRAEYLGIPERGTANSFFKYSALEKCQDNAKALFCMSDTEFIEYRNRKEQWKFYQEKLPNEVRLLCVDLALIESKANDNTACWILRLIPDGGKYRKIAAYCESMHGINALIQAKRIKQLFYELDCDYCVLDCQGVGANKLALLYRNI